MQWWNNATIRAFRERAQCMIDQYDRYKIEEVNQFMNGRMTQGENIADNGGLKQAFRVSIYCCVNINLIAKCLRIQKKNCAGLSKMGSNKWWRARNTRLESDAQSIVFPKLCTNLVWFDATRRCPDKNSIIRSFARIRARPWATVQFKRLCQSVQLPVRLANESNR